MNDLVKKRLADLGLEDMFIPEKLEDFLGRQVYIKTVNLYYMGFVVAVGPEALTLIEVTWIARTGRWANELQSGGENQETEPYPVDWPVCLLKQAIIEIFEWPHELYRTQRP